MKKTLFLLLALMMSLMASADEVIDGIKYNCYTVGNVNYAQVKGYEAGLTIANIPGSVTSGGKQYTVTSIGQSAFASCNTLTSVTFPNSMVAISNLAFSGCTSLTSITIPSGMTESIGYGVFQGCTSLSTIVVNSGNTKYNSGDNNNAIIETSTKKLIAGCQNTTIPNTVTKIGQRAFSGLNNLTSINIPSSVKTIEEGAFIGTGLTSVDLSNVTSIGDNAFNSCTGLTSVTTKASIGMSAFKGCTDLTSVTMTSGTTIDTYAFQGCSSLTSVTMPNTLTSIGDFAFDGTLVKSVTIPSSVTSIGDYAFVPSGGLTSVTVERTSPCTITNHTFPSSWKATLYVPKGSKASYEAANYWKDFGTIKLSGLIEQTLALTSIPTKTYGDAAFSLPATTEEGLTLTWSVANTNVATVSSNVFTIKGAGTTTVTATQAGNDDYEAFSREFTLTVNKAQLTIIANDQSMTYGNLITSLGAKYYGFKYDEEPYGTLTTLPTIACSATNTSNVGTYNIVVSGAKAANYNITHINGTLTINKAPLTITAKSYTINQKDDLPEFEVTYDGFKNSQTSSVLTTLPTITCDATDSETAGVFDITPSGAAATNYSFSYVKGNLTIEENDNIIFADANVKALCVANWDTNDDGELSEAEAAAVTSIGSVFQNNKEITSFNELQYFTGLTSIGSAFYSCSSLTSVSIPDGVTSIGSSAFEDCSSLTSITIPDGVTSIESCTFRWCSSLTSVSIPDGVTSIGEYAFYNCSSLTSITIPDGVTYIGSNAFSGMAYISFMSTTPLANTNFLPYNTVILVPDAVVDDYKSAWPDYQHKIVGHGENVWKEYTLTAQEDYSDLATQVGEENLRNVTKLRLSGTMNSYDMMVIRNKMINLLELDLENVNIVANNYEYYTGCHSEDDVFGANFLREKGILSVVMPSSITSIGDNAFYYCGKLRSITNLTNNLTFIGSGVFRSCNKITSFDLPESLTTIGSSAFEFCEGLTSIIIPEGMTTIDYGTFKDCRKLSNVYLAKETTRIGDWAFTSCVELSEINLPPALNSIGDYAFGSCENLKKVYAYMPDVPELNTNSFSTYQTATLYVPEFLYNSYFYDTNWSQFLSIETCSLSPDDYLKLSTNQDVTFSDGDERIPDTSEDEHIDGEVGNQGGITVEGDDPQPFDEMDQNLNGEGQGGSLIGEDDGETPGNLQVNTLNVKIQVQANRWYFFCFPFDVTIANCEYPGQYAWRKYDGEARAGGSNGWKNVGGTKLNANQGYIFQSSATGKLVVKFEAPTFGGDRPKTLAAYASDNAANASWNFVGNPYSSFYEFTDEDFDAPITVWNGTSYEAYRPGDDDYHLQPYQAFFVQKPTETNKIDFKQDNRETYRKSLEKKAMSAKALRMKGIKAERLLVNLNISDNDTSAVDKTRLVLNEKASRDYEMTCDAAKFISNDANAQLYTLEGSVQMAINERPTEGDIRLGYNAKKAGTLSIEAPRMDLPMALVDTKTGTTFDLSLGSYEFKTEAGTFNTRFLLRPTEEATAIKDMTQKTGVAIGLQDGGLSIGGADGKNIEIYTVGGALTAQKSGNGFVSLPRGTYLVKVDGASAKIHVK